MLNTPMQPQTSSFNYKELVKETLYQSYTYPYLIIDSRYEIVYSQGNLQPYLIIKDNAKVNLLETAALPLRSVLLTAIEQVATSQQAHTTSYLSHPQQQTIHIRVNPLAAISDEKLYWVSFIEESYFPVSNDKYLNATSAPHPSTGTVDKGLEALQLLSKIAVLFNQVSDQALEDAFATALKDLAAELNADKVRVIEMDEQVKGRSAYSWVYPAIKDQTTYTAPQLPDVTWLVQQNQPLYVLQVSTLPEGSWKHSLLSEQINTILIAPLVIEDKWIGLLELSSKTGSLLSSAQASILANAVAAIFSNALYRKKTNQQVKLSEKRIQQFQQVARLGHWEFDTEIKNVKWSEETYRIYGYAPSLDASACFKDVLKRKPLEEKNQFKRMVKASLKKRKPYNYDIKIVTPQNEVKYAHVIGQPLEDDNGQIIKLHGMILDITERKQAEEKLKHALQQKEILLKEVYHRVKNNLAMVEGLIFLQKNLIKEQKYIDIFDECEKRIHSMALIHRNLYQSENLNTIDINKYIHELVQHIAASSSRKDEVEINIKVKTSEFDLNQAIPLGLITNELVTNSFKYAFKNIAKPRLSVSLIQYGEKYEFIVKDNGTGFEVRPEHERHTLGISLVTMLTGDLNGEIFFNNTAGTETKIIF